MEDLFCKVLFLCTFDPFGLGYAKYSFQNLCMEDRKLCLEDGTEKVFYNCIAEEIPEQLKYLYEYIRTGKVGDDLTQRIDKAVIRARKNEEWRSEYMKELLHDDDVRAEGRAEGEARGKANGAIGMCKELGLSFEETAKRIREKFRLSEEEVQRDMKLYW